MIAECPRCQCNDIEKAGRTMQWGKSWQRWQCNECGHDWTAAPEEKPEEKYLTQYLKTQCPACGSIHTLVTSTRDEARYHKCQDCGRNFKSIEQNSL
jgi:transposase-like protein